MVQLQEILPRLEEMGYKLIAICPDKPEELRKTRKKLKLSFILLSDKKMSASRAFGIAFVQTTTGSPFNRFLGKVIERASGEKHHQLPVPSVFIVNNEGVIQFVHYNPDYRVRIEPERLIKEAKKAREKM